MNHDALIWVTIIFVELHNLYARNWLSYKYDNNLGNMFFSREHGIRCFDILIAGGLTFVEARLLLPQSAQCSYSEY